MPKTLVRRASSTDFETLLSIDQSCFPPGIAYDSEELSYYMDRNNSHTLVAETDGTIAGFIVLEIIASRSSATIITLDIPEKHRRQGYASTLLAASEEILHRSGVERYILQVDENNAGAIAFYRKHGFETVHTIPHYYPNGNNAFLMVKHLG
jgi:[ribosomal protein S18]-alanine N-acetyltransferase